MVAKDQDPLERSDGKDETLERAVLDAVPGAGRVLTRLLRVELLDLRGTKAEEVDELRRRTRNGSVSVGKIVSGRSTYLGSGVNLGLPDVLALAEHGRSADLSAVLGRDQVGSLKKGMKVR